MIRYIHNIHDFDLRTFLSIYRYTAHNSLIKLAYSISRSADGWLYFILFPLILFFKPAQFKEYLSLALIGYGLERFIYYILKNSIKRKRPAQAIPGVNSIILASDEFSLPSGHTSAAFFFTTFLCFGFSLMFLPLYLWAMAVGISRVILGVHFVTDILAGAVMGSTIALFILFPMGILLL